MHLAFGLYLAIARRLSVFCRWIVVKHIQRRLIFADGVKPFLAYFNAIFCVGLPDLVLKTSALEVFVKSFECFHC